MQTKLVQTVIDFSFTMYINVFTFKEQGTMGGT